MNGPTLLWMLLLECLGPWAGAQVPSVPAYLHPAYALAWADEFDSAGMPSPARWRMVWDDAPSINCNAAPGWAQISPNGPYYDPDGPQGPQLPWAPEHSEHLDFYQQVVVDDSGGRLRLRASAIPDFPCRAPVWSSDSAAFFLSQFQQGGVFTKFGEPNNAGKLDFCFGYYELRAKWPRAYTQIVPNWWLFGMHQRPSWYEVDFFETVTPHTQPHGAIFSLHLCEEQVWQGTAPTPENNCTYDCHLDKWDSVTHYANVSHPKLSHVQTLDFHTRGECHECAGSGWTCSHHPMTDDDWHVYGCELTPTHVRLYIDHQLVEEVRAPWLRFFKGMYMYIHMGIGECNGVRPGLYDPQTGQNLDPELRNFAYEIDYVRYYILKDSPLPKGLQRAR